MELIKVEGLSFTYPNCEAPAISGVSFTAESGSFNVLCGATGCGKSTLLRLFKRELTIQGSHSGRILFCGRDVNELSAGESASKIGFVMQDPEQQIVTDKVWHELAFGLESLGTSEDVIARRTAEMASYFGIGEWYDRDTAQLSGGQKQLLNLASIMVMQPELLILDEPTAQLDPVAASDFISTLRKLNDDFGITIIIAEHRLEEVIPICSELMIMSRGKLIAQGEPRRVVAELEAPDIMLGMPSAARLFRELGTSGRCPLTVREGRELLAKGYSNDVRNIEENEYTHSPDAALEFRDVYFRYSKGSPDVLRGLNMKVYTGEAVCILGGNGSGKTTSLCAAAGLLRPYSGSVSIFGKKLRDYKNQSLYRGCLAMLPQDVRTVFLKNSVREELADSGIAPDELPFSLDEVLDSHPYDLSGGQMQLAALAKVLAVKPRLLLLDEPTKALDPAAKRNIARVIANLKSSGMTVVIVTHDIEFAAQCADRCMLFFNGRIVSQGTPRVFFSGSSFYTTAISRMTRGFFDNAATVEDAVELCRRNGVRHDSDKK